MHSKIKESLLEGLGQVNEILNAKDIETHGHTPIKEVEVSGKYFVENSTYEQTFQAPIYKTMLDCVVERGELSTDALFDLIRVELLSRPKHIAVHKTYQLCIPKRSSVTNIIEAIMTDAGIINYSYAVHRDIAEVVLFKTAAIMGCGSFVIDENTNSLTGDILNVKLIASRDLANSIARAIKNTNYTTPRYINVYKWDSSKRMMRVMRTAIDSANLGHESFYPFVNQGVDALLKEYSESAVPVLLLIGPPGTGKSTFMRTMVCEGPFADRRASLVFGTAAKPDTNFIDTFYDCGSEILLVEDADEILLPRVEGNSVMADLLNNTSGVVGAKKKIVISTNLEDLSNVDPALLRGGRLFGIVSFRKLSYQESLAVLEAVGNKHGVAIEPDVTYSLADLLEPTVIVDDSGVYKRQFGFNQKG